MFRDENLCIEDRVKSLIGELTVEEKFGLLSSAQQPIERLGIKERQIGTEFARGWSSHEETQICTVFPQSIGMASTFDEELIAEAGRVAGRESRAYYNSINKSLFGFGPTVDLERDPRWGRHEEGYGEDPCLTGVMSSSYTRALAGDGKVKQTLPLLKHFLCNNTETDRATYDVEVSDRLLNEYYLEVFRKPIEDGGAFGVMGAYNKINGEPGLLTSLNQKYVKDKWGGRLVVSDGHAFGMIMEAHKMTESHAESMALALKAGANIMLDKAEMVIDAAREAYEKGLIDEALIDNAISDTLYLRFLLGEFDSVDPYADVTMDMVNTDEDKKLALKMSEEQVILLKNDGILPLKKEITKAGKIAVVGPQADENFMDWYTGASSYDITVKDGIAEACPDAEIMCDHGRDFVKLKYVATGKYLRVLDDLTVKADADEDDAACFEKYDWGAGYVNFMDRKTKKMLAEDSDVIKCTSKDAYQWFVRPIMTPHDTEGGVYFTSWDKRKLVMNDQLELDVTDEGEAAVFEIELISDGDERCKELAKDADLVICCVGNHPVQVGREGYDRADILLPPRQEKIAKNMLEVNKNTILLIVSSYPYAVDDFDNTCPAICYTTHAGPELGRAVANIVCGKANPSGRLASTWYKKDFVFPSIFDYDIEKNKMTYMYLEEKPLYAFGYGLSYSSFEYTKFVLDEASADDSQDNLLFRVNVKNTSDTDGAEVVQIYYKKDDSTYIRPIKKLIGFTRVNLAAGEEKTVEVKADKHMLECYDDELEEFVFEMGKYSFEVGAASDDIRCTIEYEL